MDTYTWPIEVEDLTVAYGRTKALDKMSLRVGAGTVTGLLGPNGAGKTTLVRVLATLMRPQRGTARVMGHNVVGDALGVRRKIGLAGQFAAVDQELTGRENLETIGRLYHLPRAEARRRATAILERFGLADVADRRAGTYSGAMRRRLDLASSLTGRPPVLLLDEPTTGLDPRSRQELWAIVDELRRDGTTVLLTTQYLEEADRLAQHIAVLDGGTVIAYGTPAVLKAGIGADILRIGLHDPADVPAARLLLAGLGTIEDPLSVRVTRPDASVEALRRLDAAGLRVSTIELARPSLDDVFLHLTGHPTIREESR
ncbi:ATP-binding cassette domain-containing protein [Actinoplanes couchii]|uniref:Daunorubicin resistance protein DrrA family ABC transporter ATP-binding protein n=1 Tax=Actinoplanes couchii TaxID=403638 RepID=A0ABQ3X8M2_9ACTN|nr:ATP-binding cassette domain-containing protein [Actinoplanes couchii]MDR6320147.1 ABC-2 type transport system ATP-binding protein [Actinoplanes couchii]GID54839.1 daunorubicin resistance protein DrrA family ABC transporter ATP-binding protein [Actinoplanes couchii]